MQSCCYINKLQIFASKMHSWEQRALCIWLNLLSTQGFSNEYTSKKKHNKINAPTSSAPTSAVFIARSWCGRTLAHLATAWHVPSSRRTPPGSSRPCGRWGWNATMRPAAPRPSCGWNPTAPACRVIRAPHDWPQWSCSAFERASAGSDRSHHEHLHTILHLDYKVWCTIKFQY